MQRKETEMKRRAMANDYKILCSEANRMIKMKNGSVTSNGWTKIDGEYNKRTNFKGVLYTKNNEYAICFVGTDKWNYKDHVANIQMSITGDSKQINEAQQFAEKMKQCYKLNNKNTVSIGHSEGGTEATVVGLENNMKTVTFNAYGIGKKYKEANKNYNDLIINYRDAHDPVSKLRENVGQTYITPSTQNQFMSKTPFGSIQAHGIKQMGDCNNAVPVNYYKQTHPLFIDKISDKDISRKDIGEMNSDLFKVYEKEIDKRMMNGGILANVSMDIGTPKSDLFGTLQGINEGNNGQMATINGSRGLKTHTSKTSSHGKWVTINGNHVLIKD